jgi:hypothetical protein
MLSPSSSSVLEDEIAIAIANTKEEIGLGDQEGDEQLPFEFLDICTERQTGFEHSTRVLVQFHVEEKTLRRPTSRASPLTSCSY